VDVAAQPGQGIGRDIGRGEGVEHELDVLITRRHDAGVSFARTLGVEQSELISRLDTFATKKRKACQNSLK
jgi:hypothetical protein